MALFDLFRPQWKHSDPARRAEAMRLLEDNRQDVFLAALADADASVRLAAARRVKGEENARKALAKIAERPDAERPDDKAVREVLHKTLLPLVSARIQAARGVSAAEAHAWVAEVSAWSAGNEKPLEAIALEAADPVVRRTALAGLTHAGGLLAVALRDEDGEIAQEALGRLSRDMHYEAVAKSAKNRAAREAARARLRAREDAKKPDAAAIARAKAAILMSTVAKAATESATPEPGFDWAGTHEHVEEAARTFGSLAAEGFQAPDAERAHFEARVAEFRERHAAHVAAEVARRERDEAEARVRAARESICERLETWYAESRVVSDEEMADAARAFREAGGADARGGKDESDELHQRFLIARERLKDRMRRQHASEQAARSARDAEQDAGKAAQRAATNAAMQAEKAARREAARAEAAPALEAVITELEKLAGAADPKTGDKRLRDLQSRGKELLALLGTEGQGIALRYHAAADQLRETLEWSRWSNLQRKQALLEELETLAQTVAELLPDAPAAPATAPAAEEGSESPEAPAAAPVAVSVDASGTEATLTPPAKRSGNLEATRPLFVRFKELLGEWKTIGPVTWDATETVWDRYHALADGLYEKFRDFFAELDEEREANFKAKEELCAKLEELMASPEADSRETNEAFREAHSAWKAIGAVPRDKADALWERFRAVNKAYQDKREGSLKENLAAKRALITQAEELKDSTAWKKTADRIKELQEQWKAIGPVPRDKADTVWNRFHAACETFFTARRAFYEQLDAERPVNLARKTALCERVEKLDELPDDRARYEAILDAQAQWKEIGPVPREQEDALWERFRQPIDAYFEAHRERTAEERALREAGAKAKEALCVEAEALKDSTDRRTAAAFKDLQARWKDSPPAPRHLDRALWTRFRAACDAYFERLKAETAVRDGDPEANLHRKEDLCFAVEIMAGIPPVDEDARLAREAWVETQLSSGRGAPTEPQSAAEWQHATGKVKALQQEWRTIGHVPRAESDAIWARFRTACDAFFEAQRQAFAPAEEDPQRHLEEKLALIAEAEELAEDAGLANLPVVQDLQRRWKRAGAVPRAQVDSVEERFQKACDAALAG